MTKHELYVWVWTKLPICGCGQPRAVLEKLRDLLRVYRPREHASVDEIKTWGKERDWVLASDGADGWLWLYLLDHLGLCEHGGSAASGWTTGVGDEICEALTEYGCDPDQWDEEFNPDDVFETGEAAVNLIRTLDPSLREALMACASVPLMRDRGQKVPGSVRQLVKLGLVREYETSHHRGAQSSGHIYAAEIEVIKALAFVLRERVCAE